jgi:hypothetical protein
MFGFGGASSETPLLTVDIPATEVWKSSTITTIYSQIIQAIAGAFVASATNFLLVWFTSPKRPYRYKGEDRFYVLALHGAFQEQFAAFWQGIKVGQLRPLAMHLLWFLAITSVGKVAELLIPSQINDVTRILPFSPSAPVSLAENLRFSEIPSSSDILDDIATSTFYSQSNSDMMKASISSMAYDGIYSVVSGVTNQTLSVRRKDGVSIPVELGKELIDFYAPSNSTSANSSSASSKQALGKILPLPRNTSPDNPPPFVAVYINRPTQEHLDKNYAERIAEATKKGYQIQSVDSTVPGVMSSFKCHLQQFIGYDSGTANTAVRPYNTTWGTADIDAYLRTTSIYQYNGIGGVGRVTYALGDGGLPTFNRTYVLSINAETTAANLLNDMSASPFFNTAATSAMKQGIDRFLAARSGRTTLDLPILRHRLYFYCEGAIAVGDTTVSMADKSIAITKFATPKFINTTASDMMRSVQGKFLNIKQTANVL